MNKNDFYNELISFNRNITSHKTKYLGVQNKFNSLIRKSYNSFLVRICFTSNDKYQNLFYQPTLDTLQVKNNKGTDYVLNCKSKGVFNSKLKPLYNLFGYKMGLKFDRNHLAV